MVLAAYNNHSGYENKKNYVNKKNKCLNVML